MLDKNYIVFKIKGSSYGQVINLKTRRRYVFVRIPRKYLTLNTLKYIDHKFTSFSLISQYSRQDLELYVSNDDMVNLARYLEKAYLSLRTVGISWIYVK